MVHAAESRKRFSPNARPSHPSGHEDGVPALLRDPEAIASNDAQAQRGPGEDKVEPGSLRSSYGWQFPVLASVCGLPDFPGGLPGAGGVGRKN